MYLLLREARGKVQRSLILSLIPCLQEAPRQLMASLMLCPLIGLSTEELAQYVVHMFVCNYLLTLVLACHYPRLHGLPKVH
jgi:hypothetical protein